MNESTLQQVTHLGLVDHGVFTLMLGVSVAIGLYFAFCDDSKTVDDYILGGKSMSRLPIACSMIAGTISGTTLIGIPSEIYAEGATFVLTLPTLLIAGIFAKHFFLPIYCDLKITSIFEYLEMRFDRRVRLLASFFFSVSSLLYLPAVIYVPSISLSLATGIGIYTISSVITSICVFYTMIGGVKAVVWTDFIQLVSLIMAIFAILIIGTYNVGGIGNVFDLADKGNKLNIFNFDPSPFQRQSFWICTIGQLFQNIVMMANNQAIIQRFLSLPSSKDFNFVIAVYFVGCSIVTGACIYNGLLVYATYFGCDPVQNKVIDRGDQIFPYFVLDKIGHIPGLSGIFLAGVVSAAMSTLSTGLHTMSGVVYEDFMKTHAMTEKRARFFMKIVIVLIGVYCIFSVMLFKNMGKILSASYALIAIVYEPVGVIFILGMFLPWSNTKGAIFGALVAALLQIWITLGATLNEVNFGSTKIYPEEYNTCPNMTLAITSSNSTTSQENDGIFPLYKISYMLYNLVVISFGVICGLVVSFITGTSVQDMDPRLICSPLRRFLPKKKEDPSEMHIMSK